MGVGGSKARHSRKTRKVRGGGPKSESLAASVSGIGKSGRSRLPEIMSALRRAQRQQNVRRRTLNIRVRSLKKEENDRKKALTTLKRKEAAAKASATRAAKKAASAANSNMGTAKKAARTSARSLAKTAKKIQNAKEN